MKKLFIIATLIGIFSTSCKNRNSSTSDSSQTLSDTSVTVTGPVSTGSADTGITAAIMTPADSMIASPESHMNASKGTAKPNPAKKGMKGKVTISPAPKSTAKMEMDKAGVYSNVEVIPSFPGGYAGLQKYFDQNLQYPADASSEGVEGVVNVTFTVDENGKLTSAQTTGDKMGYGLEEEALRVVNKMPTWTPGKLKGQNVKTRYTLPVRFQLY